MRGRRFPTRKPRSGFSSEAGHLDPSGRIVPEVGDAALREIVHGNYRIVYRLTREAVEIVTVHHGARLLRL